MVKIGSLRYPVPLNQAENRILMLNYRSGKE